MVIPYAIFVFFMAANSQHPPWEQQQQYPTYHIERVHHVHHK